ncbi:MAG: DUF4388 domain-containing protein [Gemmatimonadales bacterium]|nr:MAG: DUF4388 domain-containing protein [Gemmatimonadales bacterium]
MKSARLDKILADMGYASDEHIRLALKRQRTQGGRLGENLVEMGFLTRRQLMEALSRQFQIPWRSLAPTDVPVELRRRLPLPGPHGSLAVPVRWEADDGVLVVALNDPEDAGTLDQLRREFGARRLEVHLAPDDELVAIHEADPHADLPGVGQDGIIDLPDLFASPEDEVDGAVGIEGKPTRPTTARRKILMISRRAQHRTFLPAVFSREGCDLLVVDGFDEVRNALTDGGVEAVLVDAERRDDFRTWTRSGRLPPLPARVSILSSVSEVLIDNVLPYPEMMRSLRGAVEGLADLRSRDLEPPPPYGLMGRDVEALARTVGLRAVTADGLYLAVHLLSPPRAFPAEEYRNGDGSNPPREPFHEFAASRELAVRLRFSWAIETVLDVTLALFLGPRTPEAPGRLDPEMLRAAQILALVWFHHIHAPGPEALEGEEGRQMRLTLRRAGQRLATMELVEAYLAVIHDRREAGDVGETPQVILVGTRRATDLGNRMARSRIRPVVTRDLTDAQAMAERSPPAAIVVDQGAVPGHVHHFARVAKLDASLPLYVITDERDAASTLDLLDAGVDDVFAPPHDLDLMAARIGRAIDARSRVRSALQSRGGDFSASFDAFSFLDLTQALAHGLKSVRIELSRQGTGEDAVLFLARGRPIHARCGSVVGPEAVYRIITWEEDGEFSVHPESDFPESTIHESMEALLMEGCRLLDEAGRP